MSGVVLVEGTLHDLLQVNGIDGRDDIGLLVVGSLGIVVNLEVDEVEVFNHELVLHAAVSAEVLGECHPWVVGSVPVVRLRQVVLQDNGEGLVSLCADGEGAVLDHAEVDGAVLIGEEVGVREQLGVEVHLEGSSDFAGRDDVVFQTDGVAHALEVVAIRLQGEGAVLLGRHAADLCVEGHVALFVGIGVVVGGGLIDGTSLRAYPDVEGGAGGVIGGDLFLGTACREQQQGDEYDAWMFHVFYLLASRCADSVSVIGNGKV